MGDQLTHRHHLILNHVSTFSLRPILTFLHLVTRGVLKRLCGGGRSVETRDARRSTKTDMKRQQKLPEWIIFELKKSKGTPFIPAPLHSCNFELSYLEWTSNAL